MTSSFWGRWEREHRTASPGSIPGVSWRVVPASDSTGECVRVVSSCEVDSASDPRVPLHQNGCDKDRGLDKEIGRRQDGELAPALKARTVSEAVSAVMSVRA